MAEAKTANTGQELTAPGAAQLEVIQNALLGQGELPAAADPEAMSRAIMERILNAQSFEDAFTQQDLTPWRSMLGVPVKVLDVHFNRSSFEAGEGAPIYGVFDLLVLKTKERVTVTCGGKNVLSQIIVALKNGWLDKPVRMIENTTRDGYGALWLEAVEV